VLKNPGESIINDNLTYYCVLHREMDNDATEWKLDLDDIGEVNSEDCYGAELPNNQDAGYKWTGTKCCSEADDDDEYYNDREGYNASYPNSGGCWNKTHVLAGIPPPGRLVADIVNYLGGFEGCDMTDPSILALEDTHTGEPLVNNNGVCKILENGRGPGRHLFCSYSGNWLESEWVFEGEDFVLEMKTTEWDNSTGCCAPSQCWNGSECIDDQSNSSEPITYNGHRCIAGVWDDSQQMKYTWDRSQIGYCLLESQCLADPSPYADINCIDNGDYVGKFYCDDGEWTARTRMLSLAMLKYANVMSPSDYTLFCEDYDNILTYYDYQVGGDLVLNYMGGIHCQGKPCVNEFCVLRYPGGTAFGTSINVPIDSAKSFLKALNESTDLCNNALLSDNRYHRCGSSNIWYNHLQGTIVSLPTGDAFADVDWVHDFVVFIKNPFESIKNWIVPRTTGLEFFNQTRIFTKLYAATKGSKRVFAFLEEGKTVYVDDFPIGDIDYFGFEYEGLGVSPCDLIRHYDRTISCAANQTIFAQARAAGESNLLDAWPDLTAKLRLG
jgi:hypothetical protein